MSNLIETEITIKKTFRASNDCCWIELLCKNKEDATKIEETLKHDGEIKIYM